MIWVGIVTLLVGFASGFTVCSWMRPRALMNLAKDRDAWKDIGQRSLALHEQRDITMAKWQALACGHEPGDPYTTLTPAREVELLRARLTEIQRRLS